MGFAANGVCHATEQAAADAVCASQYPVTRPDGVTESCQYAAIGADGRPWLSLLRREGFATETGLGAPLTFPTCDESQSLNPFLLTPEQGALVAVAVGAIWAAAYGWKALGRVLNTDGEKD